MWDKLLGILAGGPGAKGREERRLDVIHGPERKPAFPGVLGKRLLTYPANTPPHAGAPDTLTDEQIDANLAAFLANRDERLRHFSGLLGEFGIGLAGILTADADPAPGIDAIERWMLDYLPARSELPPHDSIVNAPYRSMWASDRAGADIVFSLAADYAILLGESIRIRKPHLFWGIDRTPLSNPARKDGGRHTWRRLVLMAERPKRQLDTPMYNAEDTALHAIYWIRSRSADLPFTSWSVKNWLESPSV
jgi:hypothetical protein